VAALVGGARAHADVGVAVVDAPRAPSPRATVEAALVNAATASGAAVIPDPARAARDNLRAGAVPREELERLRRVRELTDEGWRAYLQVSVDFAAARLGRARTDAEELLPQDGGPELYADIALRLGAVLAYLGRRAEAAEVLRLAGWLDPGRAVTTAEFSPDVIAAVEAARAQAPAAVPVRISAGPAGRRVAIEIDGRPAGTAPVATSLAIGQHVVVARGRGLRPRGLTFAVAEPSTAIDVPLDEDVDAAALEAAAPLAIGASAGEASRALDAVLLYGDLDAVVVAASVWSRGEPALLGQRCQGSPVRCGPVVEVGYGAGDGALAAAAAALWRQLADGARRPTEAPVLLGDARIARGGGAAGRGGPCRWCRNPWVWTGVGVALAAVVTGAAIAASAEDRTIVTVDPGDFGGR